MKTRILIIEDEDGARTALEQALKSDDVEVLAASSGEEGLALFADNQPVPLVLTDVRLPGIDGTEVFRQLRETDPRVYVIVMTAYGSISQAVDLIREGAYHFVEKPLDLKGIRRLVAGALDEHGRLGEATHAVTGPMTGDRFEGMIGRSARMQEVFERIVAVASSRATVLITGENGTGKELVARAIHQRSPRADRPIVEVNLSAYAPTLVEDELFGHEPGAYTDARELKIGVFERADGGTLFLDEIGEISSEIQVKLLRVLEDRRFTRLGGTEKLHADVRLIAATNRDLPAAVADGSFREDLYYRINVIGFELPPLRQRRDDISLLVSHFVRKYAEENDRTVTGVTDEAMGMLERYAWPGNVRQLENCIETAVVLSREDVLGEALFPLDVRRTQVTQDEEDQLRFPLGTSLSEVEKEMILRTLEHVAGNKTQAAKILGISPRTLYRKLDEYEGQGEAE